MNITYISGFYPFLYCDPFTVTSGVIKQGGVLSSYLFAVYLDEFSEQLGSTRTACTMENMFVNHLISADCICLFNPSIILVDSKTNVFWRFVVTMLMNTKLFCNCNKTIGVLFPPNIINNLLHQMFF